MDVEKIATTTTMDADEDLFFADLKDRLSLLMLEDEDVDEFPTAQWKWPSDPFQVFSYAMNRPVFTPPPPPSSFLYEVPLRREVAKGTGVFIPTSTIVPRRKNRGGRSKQGNRSRKAGGLDPPAAEGLGSRTSSARGNRQPLPAGKKGMLMV